MILRTLAAIAVTLLLSCFAGSTEAQAAPLTQPCYTASDGITCVPVAPSTGLPTICESGCASAPTIPQQAGTTTESCHVLAASAQALYSLTVTIGATSGWVLVFNATSAPADGAVTPKWWFPISSNGTSGQIAAAWVAGASYATGITACFSTTGPFTKTASATAQFSWQSQ